MVESREVKVQIKWIRPTKICALIDLFIATLFLLWGLFSKYWVVDTEDDNFNTGLWNYCYRVKYAEELAKHTCHSLNGRADNQVSDAWAVCPDVKYLEDSTDDFLCNDLDKPLPWVPTNVDRQTGFYSITKLLVGVCFLVNLVCFVIGLFVYIAGSSKDKQKREKRFNFWFRLIGIILYISVAASITAVVNFALGFEKKKPYTASIWKFSYGWGATFGASILNFIAATLFLFGSKIPKSGYTASKSFTI